MLCHFDYGDFVIDLGTKSSVDRIDRLYVRAIRCVEYRLDVNSRSSIENLYQRYKLEPLGIRRKRNLLNIRLCFLKAK